MEKYRFAEINDDCDKSYRSAKVGNLSKFQRVSLKINGYNSGSNQGTKMKLMFLDRQYTGLYNFIQYDLLITISTLKIIDIDL